MPLIESIPIFLHSATHEEFRAAFDIVQCVLFQQVDTGRKENSGDNGQEAATVGTKRKRHPVDNGDAITEQASDVDLFRATSPLDFQAALLHTFESATPRDQASWTTENATSSSRGSRDDEDTKTRNDDTTNNKSSPKATTTRTSPLYSPSEFLSPTATHNGYCSFLLRDDSEQAVSNFTQNYVRHPSLPLRDLIIQEGDDDKEEDGPQEDDPETPPKSLDNNNNNNNNNNKNRTIAIAKPYWLFVGRNTSPTQTLPGRTEHIDEIHPHCGGTFHYQVAGAKRWILRPTKKALRAPSGHLDITWKDSYTVLVQQGDILVINTHLWWHQTEIPPASPSISANRNTNDDDDAGRYLSISYARDIYLDASQQPPPPPPEDDTLWDVDNQERAWATRFLAQGTTLLTDDAHPPMTRTTVPSKANCQLIVVGVNDRGGTQLAIQTTKDIQEGEFFTLLQANEGDDDDDDDDKNTNI